MQEETLQGTGVAKICLLQKKFQFKQSGNDVGDLSTHFCAPLEYVVPMPGITILHASANENHGVGRRRREWK